MLIAALLDQAEVLQVVAAALRGTVALVPLDPEPESETALVIELRAPGLVLPIVLMGRIEGESVAGMYPIRLKPLSGSHAADLRAFLRGGGTWPEGYAPASDEPTHDAGAAPGTYQITARRDPPVVIPDAPAGMTREPLVPVDENTDQSPDPEPLEMVFGAPPAPEEDRTLVDRARLGTEPAMEAVDSPPPSPPAPGRSESGERERTFAGRVLGGGKYFVQSHIGSGGAGRVYRGYHRELETTVAIKLLHELHQEDDRFVGRFRREARATSKLDHPNVMRVLDFGSEQDGLMYIVMEYLDGPNLQRVIDLEAPLPLPRVAGIMSQVCAALSAAHHIGIIHRDMKPENVIVMQRQDDEGTDADVVKVCDFGLAKIQEPTRRDTHKSSGSLTIGGTVWGTPEYMSPEQIRNERLDPRSDVYACGVILYEMATGQLPFRGETAIDIVTKHVVAEPVPPSQLVPDLDPRLEATILRALAKERDDRQQSTRDLRAELRAMLDSAAGSHASSTGVRPIPGSPDEDGVFEDSVAKTTPHVKITSLAHDIAARVTQRASPASVEEVIEQEGTMRAGDALDLALGILARQGNVAALWTIVEWLDKLARDPEGEAEPRQRAIATRALQTISDAETLTEVARALLTGPPDKYPAARSVLVTLGDAGARALLKERLSSPLLSADRGRFVEAMQEIGTAAMSALGAGLADLDPARADQEPQLVEDLLRAVPPDASEVVAQLVVRHVRSRSPGVRRAAVEALGLVLGPHAREALRSLLQDPDVGIRVAALAGLRRIGTVDADIVLQIDRILAHETDEGLASTAAAALAAVSEEARPSAVAVLTHALEPASRVARLVGTAGPRQADLVIETMARTLMGLDRAQGRETVGRRAAREREPLRSRLMALLSES